MTIHTYVHTGNNPLLKTNRDPNRDKILAIARSNYPKTYPRQDDVLMSLDTIKIDKYSLYCPKDM